MTEETLNYQEWDKIEGFRKKIKKENPELKNMERKIFYIDHEGIERCAKCGINERNLNCYECTMGC